MATSPEPSPSNQFNAKDFENLSFTPKQPMLEVSLRTIDVEKIDFLGTVLGATHPTETIRRALTFYSRVESGELQVIPSGQAVEDEPPLSENSDERNTTSLVSTMRVSVPVSLALLEEMVSLGAAEATRFLEQAILTTAEVILGDSRVLGQEQIGDAVII